MQTHRKYIASVTIDIATGAVEHRREEFYKGPWALCAAEAELFTTFTALLKEYYTDDALKDMGYRDNPWYAMIEKDEEVVGEYIPVPIIYSHARASATFATAVAQRRRQRAKQFQLTTVDDYVVVELGRKALLASRNDIGAFISAKKANIDSAIYAITRSLGQAMYGTSRGVIGTVDTDPATGTDWSLTNPEDTVHLEEGSRFYMYAPAGAVRAGGAYEIATIDRDTGDFTTTAAANAAVASGDELILEDNFNLKMSGMQGWVPVTAPGATAYFGVARNADVVRLGGVRMDLSGYPIEEGLQRLQSRVNREGGRVDVILLNNTKYTELELALGPKVVYDTLKASDVDIGFTGIRISGDKGPITVVADPNCPISYTWAITKSTWTLYSILTAPHIFDIGTDQEWLRYSSADSYELRVGYYAQVGCNAPGHNGIGTF
jgi:hypothetical protein